MWKFSGRHAKRADERATLEHVYHQVRPLREHAGAIVSLLSALSLTGERTAQRVEGLAELVTTTHNQLRGVRRGQCDETHPASGAACALDADHNTFWDGMHISADARNRWRAAE